MTWLKSHFSSSTPITLEQSTVNLTSEALLDFDFDWHRRSPVELPPRDKFRYPTLSAMLQSANADEDRRPLLIGADHTGNLEIALADLRRAAFRANEWCRQQGFQPGDSLLLVRLPHSSEIPLAVATIALMSAGIRVVLPMSYDATTLAGMIQITNTRGIFWCAAESAKHDAAHQTDAILRTVASGCNLPTFSLDGELDWHRSVETEIVGLDDGRISEEREVLVLSTSGSTGQPKLVRYTDVALLRVAEAWNAAGLMSAELTGGRSFCPTLSHSMGFRNVFHAIWNRQPTVLVQPEWLEDQPKKFVKLLERCPPQHITCGPALLADLSLLAASVRRVRDALTSLRCVVSSGANDAGIDRVLPANVRVANAFGMTEVQQVMNTLLGPATQAHQALGRPLPGVEVGVRFADSDQQVGRLLVSSPFAARGYVGSPDFDPWFDTGDLVRVEGDCLVWIGRADEDFLNTGLGVKVSLVELRAAYEKLHHEVEAVLFVSLLSRGGVAALVYVGDHDPADHDQLLLAINDDHKKLAETQRHFALSYAAISVLGCVPGRPPRRGPGKIDQAAALAAQAELIAAMDDPASKHPHVVVVPSFGSDRPDWRRFAATT
jgi:acyl-coenzyme A synthetase/AMP-(fatty) acid ligase